MRLKKIDLRGFRQLVNRSYEFKPGLNLVFGPNEAGKSSLLEALAVILYGFFDEGRISAKERDELNLHKPWSYSGEFGGTLEYILENGDDFQVRRTFAPEISTVLIRLSGRRNVTDNFRQDSDGRVYFAEEQLGINKSVFENVCVIRQAELALLEESATPIAETIMRLSSTMATEGFTVNEAIALLESTFKDRVGTTRAYSRPYAKTKNHLLEIEQAMEEAKKVREKSWDSIALINASLTDLSQFEKRYQDCRMLLLKSKLDEVRGQRATISRLQDEVDTANQKVAEFKSRKDFHHELYEPLLNLNTQRVSLENELASEPPDLVESINKLELERQQLISQSGQYQSLSTDIIGRIGKKKDEIDKASQAVEIAQQQVERHQAALENAKANSQGLLSQFQYVDIRHSDLAKLQQKYETVEANASKSRSEFETAQGDWRRANMTEDAFIALKDTPLDTHPKKGCKFWRRKSGLQNPTPSEIEIYNDLLPVYTRWKNTQAELDHAEAAIRDAEASVRRKLYLDDETTITVTVFEQATNKVDEYLKSLTASEVAANNLEVAQDTLHEAQKRLKALQDQLKEMLPEGVKPEQDLSNEYQQLERSRQRLSEIDTEIAHLNAESTKWQKKHHDSEEVVEKLQMLYREAQIDESLSFDEKLDRYKGEREKYLAWQDAEREARASVQRLQEFPFKEEKIEAQIADLEDQLRKLVDEHPAAAKLEPNETSEYYQSQVEEMQRQLQKARQDQFIIESEAAKASENMIDLANLLEERAETQAKLSELEWFGESLTKAQNELSVASTTFQKQFTPRLQLFLNDGLSHATGGRYTETLVDPETLTVRLLAPETQNWIHVDQLSTGTRDLVYLLLRFSIARLMSRSGEHLPMLLDDPFVHCDRNRKANILNYLVDQSSDKQFILLTQDDWIRDWLTANQPDCNRIIMSHEENTSIDYGKVETLADQSEVVRERLLVVDDSEQRLLTDTEFNGELFASHSTADSTQQQILSNSIFPQVLLDDLSNVLDFDSKLIEMLRLMKQTEWEVDASSAQSILEGQFLNVVLDDLNSRSLEILGDQLVYSENDLLIVTEEFRDPLAYLLDQRDS